MKLFSLIALMMTTPLWASGLIECRFNEQDLYKVSILLNEGNNGLTIQWDNADENPTATYIDGRGQESVQFNEVANTQQYLLEAWDKVSGRPDISAVMSPIENRWATIQLFIIQYGETKLYYGRCFAVVD